MKGPAGTPQGLPPGETGMVDAEHTRILFENSADGIMVIDNDGRILAVNPAAETQFERPAESLLGADFGMPMVAQETSEIVIPGGGRTKVAEMRSVEISWNGKPAMLISLRDITERKLAESMLESKSRALATLSQVNRVLVHATDEQELLQAICRTVVRHSGYALAWVGCLEQDARKNIRCVAMEGLNEEYLKDAEYTWADTGPGNKPTGRAARSGKTQVAQNIQNDDSMLLWRDDKAKHGFHSTIALPLVLEGEVFAVMTIYSGNIEAFDTEEIGLLEEMADDLAFGLRALRVRQERDAAQQEIKRQLAKLEQNLEDTITAISTIIELRDPYTAGHQTRVADLATAIAGELGTTDQQRYGIHIAGIVHDLGKIMIPADILSKPGKLSPNEYEFIKIHPRAGYDILRNIDFNWPVAETVLQHHERLDGSGYPQGLKGDEIIMEARILCVADVIEAMVSHRPYRAGLGTEMALNEIREKRGTLYDPVVVDACLKLFDEGRFSF